MHEETPKETPPSETQEQQQEITDPKVLRRILEEHQRKVTYCAKRVARYEDIMRRKGHAKLSLVKQTRAVRRLTSATMEHSQAQRIVEVLITKLEKLT